MATLLTQAGVYHCGECLQPVEFEFVEGTLGSLAPDGTAICACQNRRCERKGLRLKVRLQTIEVEELHDA